MIEGKKQAQLSAEQELKAIINELSTKAKSLDDSGFSKLLENYKSWLEYVAGKNYSYIGAFDGGKHPIYLLNGKGKEKYNGRARKCFIAVTKFEFGSDSEGKPWVSNKDFAIFRPIKEVYVVIALSQLIGDSIDVANKLLSVESIKQLKKELQDVN